MKAQAPDLCLAQVHPPSCYLGSEPIFNLFSLYVFQINKINFKNKQTKKEKGMNVEDSQKKKMNAVAISINVFLGPRLFVKH